MLNNVPNNDYLWEENSVPMSSSNCLLALHLDRSITQLLIFMYLFFISLGKLFLRELYHKEYQDLRSSLSNTISIVENIVSFPWGLMNKKRNEVFYIFIFRKKYS